MSNSISLEAISQEEEADEGDATRLSEVDCLDRSASGVVRVVLSNSISLGAISQQEEEADEGDATRLSEVDNRDRSASGVVRVVLSNSISLEAISQQEEEEADEGHATIHK